MPPVFQKAVKMNKKYFSPLDYRRFMDVNEGFTQLRKPDCDYCEQERRESKYHAGTCIHCGATLRDLTTVVIDKITGEMYEAVCV